MSFESTRISGIFIADVDWSKVSDKLESLGYEAKYANIPERIGGLEATRFVVPQHFEKVYAETVLENRKSHFASVRIDPQDVVTKPVDEAKSYIIRLLSSRGVSQEKSRPVLDWLDKVREENFLDIVTFQIWTRFNIARFLEARLLTAGKRKRKTMREEAVFEAMRQLADMTSRKVGLQDLKKALKGLDASPIIIYSPNILDLQVRLVSSQAVELGEPLKFEAQVTNNSDTSFGKSALVVSTDSEYYDQATVEPWSRGQGRERDVLSKDEMMNTTITLQPAVEKLTNDRLSHPVTFSLRTVEDVQVASKTVTVEAKRLTIWPRLEVREKFRIKGRQIEIKLRIPKQKHECLPLPIKVKMVRSSDFKFNQPAGDSPEFFLHTGHQTSIYVTPMRAGFPGYEDEITFQYYFADKELQIAERNGSKLGMVVFPNVLDMVLTAFAAIGGILSQYKFIPPPSADLATSLPNLSMWALVSYLVFRVAIWTIRTQK